MSEPVIDQNWNNWDTCAAREGRRPCPTAIFSLGLCKKHYAQMYPKMDEKTIDPNSLAFMEYVLEQWRDEKYVDRLFAGIRKEIKEFLRKDKEEILKLLMAKLQRGAVDHGNPLEYTPEEIEKEIDEERIDLIGWGFLRKFYNEKR